MAYAAAMGERARHTHRTLAGLYEAADGEQSYDSQSMPRSHRELAPLTEGAHVHPKLLCGLYGGYFTAQDCGSNFGNYLTLGCTLDGTTRFTANYDNF